jgi:hypothetical protein
MTNYKDVKYAHSGASLTTIPTSGVSSGTFADARIAESNVTQHISAFDDSKLQSDVLVLALNQANNENKAAYNLPNSFVDIFQDDTGILTETDGDRNASEYWSSEDNATATLISTAETANSSQTLVSGVVLYQNTSGTATLNTDLNIYFTCDSGSNWTQSTMTAAGTFSSGILMAKAPEVTCTAGTSIKYKVTFANQSDGSKETRLQGVGMTY